MVSDSLSSIVGSGQVRAAPHKTYTDTFMELFPHYLSIGMSSEEYWDGDSELVKAYKKAYELSVERQNTMAWLSGRYVYDALCSVSPILHAFSKSGTKPIPYNREPYPITKQEKQQAIERTEKAQYEQNRARMTKIMAGVNKKFETR